MGQSDRASVLVVGRDKKLVNALERVLSPSLRVETRERIQDIPGDCDFDLHAVNYDELTPAEMEEVKVSSARRHKPPLLLLSRGGRSEYYVEFFGQHGMTNLLAHGEEFDKRDLIVTVQKLCRGDIFGLEKYFAWGVQPLTVSSSQSTDKRDLVSQAEQFALAARAHPRLASRFSSVADEFFTNAMYNAPVGTDGSTIYAHLPRTASVSLQQGQIQMSFCGDGERLGISVCDPFGSLTRNRLLDYLAKCFRGGTDQVDEKQGGAGIGLYQIFNSVTHFVVNIKPGVKTEMIGLLKMSASYKEFASAPKSFNFFVGV